MPWSAKAKALIDEQYAPVGAAAVGGLTAALDVLAAARTRGVPVGDIEQRFAARRDAGVALRHGLATLCLGRRRSRRHPAGAFSTCSLPRTPCTTAGSMPGTCVRSRQSALMMSACFMRLPGARSALSDETAVAEATGWWSELTQAGGEGLVMKPQTFVTRNGKGLVQPAIKVRGAEYLRLVYGPECTLPDKLKRLRERWA